MHGETAKLTLTRVCHELRNECFSCTWNSNVRYFIQS